MQKLSMHSLFGRQLSVVGLCVATLLCVSSMVAQAQSLSLAASSSADAASAPGGPIRLRQPPSEPVAATMAAPVQSAAKPGEFETFVGLPRFGADMVNELAAGAADFSPLVPPEYVIQPGDEIQVSMWGSLDADMRLTVDRAGRVTIPRVGPALVAGVRFADLRDTLTRRVAQVFKNFELSASLGKLRGVRVYVTGFVQRPGAYAVAGLSTVMNAAMRAGGPSAAGSFRQIELRRQGKTVANFDLYDLLQRGDRTADRLVEPDDVIHILPVGTQVALRGSVNRQAIFELKPGETLKEVLRMGGGFTEVADRTRVSLERLDNRNDQRVVQLKLPASESMPLQSGDVLRVFSAVDASLSIQRQNKRIRVEGEIAAPGEYLLPPESTLADVVRAAGGLSPSAFVFGTNFTRQSVKASQQENYDRALRDLETDLVRSNTTQRVSSQEDAVNTQARAAANARLVERLRAIQPSGRVVLQVLPDASALPELLLEDGDRVFVPSKPSAVGVFGSVFNSGSYLYQADRPLSDYIRLAGGPTKGADEASLFVVRANGQVVSTRQNHTSWFARDSYTVNMTALPGDSVFIPEEMDKTTALQLARDWTLILYQLGLGAAGIKSTGAIK
jgi:protein involved in polysaccharide export with SLBB domain